MSASGRVYSIFKSCTVQTGRISDSTNPNLHLHTIALPPFNIISSIYNGIIYKVKQPDKSEACYCKRPGIVLTK
jgi:hypothetical protein